MTEPKVKFKKLTIYYIALDEEENDIRTQLDWVVSQSDQTSLRVADYEIKDWRKPSRNRAKPRTIIVQQAPPEVSGTTEELKPLLNFDEVAELLGCGRNTVYKLRDEGLLKATRPKGMRAYLVERTEIQRILAEGYERSANDDGSKSEEPPTDSSS